MSVSSQIAHQDSPWGCDLKSTQLPFAAAWMDLESVVLGEVSQRRRKTIWHPLYVTAKKKWCKWAYLQNRKRLIDFKNELMVAGGREIIKGFGKGMYTLLYLKRITNKDILYSTRNSAQCYVPAWMGGDLGGEPMHVYVRLTFFSVHWNYHSIVKILQYKVFWGVLKINK